MGERASGNSGKNKLSEKVFQNVSTKVTTDMQSHCSWENSHYNCKVNKMPTKSHPSNHYPYLPIFFSVAIFT